MAEGILWRCTACPNTVEAWSDGNPYTLGRDGRKTYVHHPDHAGLARAVGHDAPTLCLGCGFAFPNDSRDRWTRCPRCGSGEIRGTFHLGGCRCPACRRGVFEEDPALRVIS